jgi:hypothetical protein
MEVRRLIVRMARDNVLWSAPRIDGELLMLGFSVSEATVSRYMPPRSRRPGPSWRTFLRNEAIAFSHCEYVEERSRGDAGLRTRSYQAQLERSGAAQIAMERVGLGCALGQQRPALDVPRIALRFAERDRGVRHRAASVSGGPRRAVHNRSGAALPIRSPPRQAWGRNRGGSGQTQDVALVLRGARFHHAGT